MAQDGHARLHEFLLESRCVFEQRNFATRPLEGVKLRCITHSMVNDKKRTTFVFILKERKLTLQVYLDFDFPITPPSAQLFSDRDSVLPFHPDIDQSDGRIERTFEPGTWTPAITLRAYVVAILALINERHPRSTFNARARPGARRVYNHGDEMELDEVAYCILRSSPGMQFKNAAFVNHQAFIQVHDIDGRRFVKIITNSPVQLVQVKESLKEFLNNERALLVKTNRPNGGAHDGTVRCEGEFHGQVVTQPQSLKVMRANEYESDNRSVLHRDLLVVPVSSGESAGSPTASWISDDPPEPVQDAQSFISTASENSESETWCCYCFVEGIPPGLMNEHYKTCWRAPRQFLNEDDMGDEVASVQELPRHLSQAVNQAINNFTITTGGMFDRLENRLSISMENMDARIKKLESEFGTWLGNKIRKRSLDVFIQDQLREHANILEERITCQICMDKERDNALPCGHLICGDCFKNTRYMNRCPFCFAPYTSVPIRMLN